MKRLTVLSFLFVAAFLVSCTGAQVGPDADVTISLESVGDLQTVIPTEPIKPTQTEAEIPAEQPVDQASEATPIPCSGQLTSANQEGPYYKAGSPERASLMETDMPGKPILIFGRVFDQECNPIARAKVDFWQTDAKGEYDNVGFGMRGHLFTDEDGFYAMESIEPGVYPGRPPHIHVKVLAPDGRELLTTQMYFPGSEGSADVRAATDLLVTYLDLDENDRQQVLFNFIIRE